MNVQKKLMLYAIRTKFILLSVVNKRRCGNEALKLFCTPLARYNGREAEIFASAEKLTFEFNNSKITGYRCNANAAKRVLILHGFSSSCHKFGAYAADLVQKNYEVLAFDAPAHGRSEGKTVNAMQYAEMIELVNRLYGKVDAYIAHSFGGIALSLALEMILHTENCRVAFIAPATETTSAINGAFDFLGLKNDRVKQSLEEAIYRNSGKKAEWFSILRAVKNINAKILWAHDEEDFVTPFADALKVKADANSHIEFLLTKGLGHQKIYRDAGVRKAVVDFL